jgi:hypothetical protein
VDEPVTLRSEGLPVVQRRLPRELTLSASITQ